MSRYRFEFMTRQSSIKYITMEVDGVDAEDAEERARQALKEYPAVIQQSGVHNMLTKRTEHSVPDAVELLSVREDRRFA
jgi:hypothetical protein